MSTVPRGSLGIDKLVERQMRNWELARAQQPRSTKRDRPEVEQFVAVSRVVGLDGEDGLEIADMLGQSLGWPVFNKEILQAMARDDRIRERLYVSMDERDMGWFEQNLRALSPGEFKTNDYFRRLTETILALGRQGHAVFLGRTADLILPRTRGLRVRLTAPRATCVRLFAERHNLSAEAARVQIEEIESERAEFIRNHFKLDANRESRHDLVINVETFSAREAVELIKTALKMRRIIA